MGLKQPVFATSSLYEKKLLELAGLAYNGVYLTSTFVVESTEPHVAAFVKNYAKGVVTASRSSSPPRHTMRRISC